MRREVQENHTEKERAQRAVIILTVYQEFNTFVERRMYYIMSEVHASYSRSAVILLPEHKYRIFPEHSSQSALLFIYSCMCFILKGRTLSCSL